MSLRALLVLLLGSWCLAHAPAQAETPQDQLLSGEELRAEFEQRYAAWRDYYEQGTPFRVDPRLTPEGEQLYRQMMQLGLPALPHIMEKTAQGDLWLGSAAAWLSRRRFQRADYADPGKYGDSWTIARMLVAWWQEGKGGTERRFRELRDKWRQLKSHERTPVWTSRTDVIDTRGKLHTTRTEFTPAGEVYDAIECLGIAVLPHIVETLKAGEADFLPIALELTDGAGGLGDPTRPPEIAAFLQWWEANKERYAIPWPDEATAP